MPGRIQTDDKRPHFFLSYARSRYRPEGSDPDRWVAKLFNDLCLDVGQATGMPVPGFMDRQIPVGTSWPDHLADALANCRVFVALFSPAYFTSEYCGKEWAAFLERAERQFSRQERPFAIIPAMWVPMDTGELPSALYSMQNVPPGFPPAYAAEGLYGIMKLGRYREQYKETVFRLANIIKDRAAECALQAGPVADLDSLRNPFAESPPAARRHPVRLTLAAQRLDQLPQDRDAYYYGRTAREWTPYRSHDNTTPIGSFAEQVLTELGHHPTVDSIDEPARDAEEAPSVLVVDPWATKDQAIGDRLRQLDEEPANVLAPFNAEDQQTASSATELTKGLTEMLPNSIALNGSAKRIPTMDAFRDALPKAVNEAITRFFKTTDTYPPQTPPTMQRPRLDGPDF
jgi:FxsC-like protein